jgi:hypothetical protein
MVVDGLDSCEQDQVLYVLGAFCLVIIVEMENRDDLIVYFLDSVHLLFTEQSSPFITLLAIDPHIIIKVQQ